MRAPSSRSGSAMAGESCHSRSLSWLARSCIPADPARHTAVPVPIPTPAATNLTSTHSNDEEESPISALPDDILLECLARVPHASLPPLPAVCRRFAALLASHAFINLLRAHGNLRPTLLALSIPSSSQSQGGSSTFSRALLQLDASRPKPPWVAALPMPQTLLHLHCRGGGSYPAFAHARAVAVGRAVFLIGRGATLRVDALTGLARSCAPTLFPRRKFAAAASAGTGRVYVAGGSSRTAAVEEYDPAADAWRVVAQAPRRRYGCVGACAGGVLYVAGGVAVSSQSGIDARVACAAGTVDALHLASGAWARPRAVPGGGCVVGACGAGDHLYVVASHAVELSFWRLGGGVTRRGGWVALEAPPVPWGSVGLGVAVRVAMASVGGGDRVVAVVNVSPVRGRVAAAGAVVVDGLVLVYDIACGKWSRAPDLPPGFRRAACVAVEC